MTIEAVFILILLHFHDGKERELEKSIDLVSNFCEILGNFVITTGREEGRKNVQVCPRCQSEANKCIDFHFEQVSIFYIIKMSISGRSCRLHGMHFKLFVNVAFKTFLIYIQTIATIIGAPKRHTSIRRSPSVHRALCS